MTNELYNIHTYGKRQVTLYRCNQREWGKVKAHIDEEIVKPLESGLD